MVDSAATRFTELKFVHTCRAYASVEAKVVRYWLLHLAICYEDQVFACTVPKQQLIHYDRKSRFAYLDAIEDNHAMLHDFLQNNANAGFMSLKVL